ncbi:MAG TPA: malonate decarboxylase acyl carrier protein [Herbaspirillum sp.]|jgi:malonate decarboxylase delta subunit|nr:malonate decarboxylase acyl carrier protein [Herbaspirillum sp.]
METLHFRFEAGPPQEQRRFDASTGAAAKATLVGVVGSGNLEVLIEPSTLEGACTIAITTAARGFGAIWEAVMRDFHQRWHGDLADVAISINDMGATPAVVSLRLDQAVEAMLEQP